MISKGKIYSKYLMSHGRKISYTLGGNDDVSEYILFISGIFSTSGDWAKQKRKFEKQYKMIFFNYTNANIEEETNQTRNFFDIITDDIEAILKNENAKKIVIIAHSMGGIVGLYFTSRFPEFVKKIILINSGVEFGLHIRIVITSIIKTIEERNVSLVYLYPFLTAWFNSDDYLVRITNDNDGYVTFNRRREPVSKDQYDVIIRLLYCVFDITQVLPPLDSIDSPVLFISSTNDVVFPMLKQKKQMKALKNIRSESFDEFTHNIHVEYYNQVNNMIASFINE